MCRAVEDCGAVNGVERVDDVNTQANPIPTGAQGVQTGLEGGPGKFACSLPIEPQLGRAERGERLEGFI